MAGNLFEEVGGHGASTLVGLVIGGLAAWFLGRWKRHQERRSILKGDARETIVIQQHLVEPPAAGPAAGPATLRIRALGQGELNRVIPNGHLASVLHHRAFQVTSRDTLISMDGAEGSYLLETLTNFVCDRVANAPFDHDLYVMAPCCEPAGLAVHQPIAILLISVRDLAQFESWPACRHLLVEHGSDGARILTLMELARRFRKEQEKIADLRRAAKRTRYVETMYVLDLALDRRSAPLEAKEVPWGRFEEVLRQMNLE